MSTSVERILLAFHEIPIEYILDCEVVKDFYASWQYGGIVDDFKSF